MSGGTWYSRDAFLSHVNERPSGLVARRKKKSWSSCRNIHNSFITFPWDLLKAWSMSTNTLRLMIVYLCQEPALRFLLLIFTHRILSRALYVELRSFLSNSVPSGTSLGIQEPLTIQGEPVRNIFFCFYDNIFFYGIGFTRDISLNGIILTSNWCRDSECHIPARLRFYPLLVAFNVVELPPNKL